MTVEVVLRDSITRAAGSDRGCVVVSGSHGGRYAGYCAARAGVRAVLFNDAAVGKDKAGIAGLDYLQEQGMAAVAVSHMSARIGDARDCLARGRLSHLNTLAYDLGCRSGQSAREAVAALRAAPMISAVPPPLAEGRRRLPMAGSGPPVWLVDSGALVRPEDAGAILVVGSHGGLPGGRPENALAADACLAVFHDAGVGIDRAGLGRLPALQARGIAAATVAGETARIGDSASLYATGILSHCNDAARALGLQAGMSCRDAIDALTRGRQAGEPHTQTENEA